MKYKYEAIIFDFDGVILASVDIKTEAFREIYTPYGSTITQKVVDYHINHGGISRYEKFKYWHKEYLDINLDNKELEKLAKQFSSIVYQKILVAPFINGADQFLRKHAHLLPCFVCTGTPEKEILKIILERKLGQYFREVLGSPKSKITINNYILEKYHFNPTKVLFIGDAMTDYNAAKNTNLDFIGVLGSHAQFPIGTKVIKDLKFLENYIF